MNKLFEDLCTLIDAFWQEQTWDKPGAKPKQFPDFYLKLYWFGLLFGCTEKGQFLPRGEREYPRLFKKTCQEYCFTTTVGN